MEMKSHQLVPSEMLRWWPCSSQHTVVQGRIYKTTVHLAMKPQPFCCSVATWDSPRGPWAGLGTPRIRGVQWLSASNAFPLLCKAREDPSHCPWGWAGLQVHGKCWTHLSSSLIPRSIFLCAVPCTHRPPLIPKLSLLPSLGGQKKKRRLWGSLCFKSASKQLFRQFSWCSSWASQTLWWKEERKDDLPWLWLFFWGGGRGGRGVEDRWRFLQEAEERILL